MSLLGTYGKLLKNRASARFITFFLLVSAATIILFLRSREVSGKPFISSIDPPVASPEDTLTIRGGNFGAERGTSYVDIAGSHVTGSRYTLWTNTEIQLKLPTNVQDGLVSVCTTSGQSEPAFFANKSSIPVALRTDPKVTQPVIESVSPQNAAVGELITISGSNFGTARENSAVCFTANRKGIPSAGPDVEYIPASQLDYDYELWSNSEIRVRVPDGADSGQLQVRTGRGRSIFQHFTVNFPAGKKSYGKQRTYVVQLSANIESGGNGQDSSVMLYMPRPVTSALQPEARLEEVSPEPLIADDLRNIIFQTQLKKTAGAKQVFSATTVVSLREFSANIDGKKIGGYSNTGRLLYKTCTSQDACIPSADKAITALRDSIAGKEKNPFRLARLFYDYMTENFRINASVRSGDISALDLLQKKSGDAYDFAVVYTALCRSAGIPAVPVCGILAENQNTSRCHWWTEIYFEKYGWFPVDAALGAGLQYNAFSQVEDARNFYFGNMDSQHIAFSRGWNQIKPSVSTSKVVRRPRSYALQSVWEEAGEAASSYSSLWNDPVIIGIY